MRSVYKGPSPLALPFASYRDAKPYLLQRTGSFCHLCEIKSGWAVEHILPQAHFPHLQGDWDNFLLICVYCNSRKLKSIPKQPIDEEYYWPHLNNTLLCFDYEPHPFPVIIPSFSAQHDKAQALIDLYALNARATQAGDSDARYIARIEALLKAFDRKKEYQDAKCTVAAICDMAHSTGFFSLWLKVFEGLPQVYQALLADPRFHLQGQTPPVYDPSSFALLPRNPADSDPL